MPPEMENKFTPEQRVRLGQVYAMILRWNREDDLMREQAGTASMSQGGTLPAETTSREK